MANFWDGDAQVTPAAPWSADPVVQAPSSPQSGVMDFFRSIPGGIASGIANTLSAGGQASQIEMGQPVDVPSPVESNKILQQQVTGPLPQPQGMAGRVGASIGEALGSPASYIGPGGLPLKIGGAILGGAGGQLGEEAGGAPGRFAGALIGGWLAGKIGAPGIPKAEIPNYAEVKGAASAGYKTARNTGLEIDPAGIGRQAASWEQELLGPEYGFTDLPNDAKNTFGVLSALQNPPAGAKFTSANLDGLRKYLGRTAQQTQSGPTPGSFKPTPDAAAASVVLGRLKDYMSGPIQNDTVAGDAQAYVRAVQQANQDYSVAQTLKGVDTRIDRAGNQSNRQIAGNLDSQIKAKVGGLIDTPFMNRLTPEEQQQAKLINSGNWLSNTLRQVGRGGTGVVPIGMEAIAGLHNPEYLPWIVGTAGALYGAKKAAEAMTISRANTLANMIAKRSSVYQTRANALPTPNFLPGQAALMRGGMLGLQ